jgi:hypothetical protein
MVVAGLGRSWWATSIVRISSCVRTFPHMRHTLATSTRNDRGSDHTTPSPPPRCSHINPHPLSLSRWYVRHCLAEAGPLLPLHVRLGLLGGGSDRVKPAGIRHIQHHSVHASVYSL